MLRMCYDPRVLIGLAAVGVTTWVVAPQLVLAVLPLLFLAACPLSMLLMAKMMMPGQKQPGASMDPRARVAALEQAQARLAQELTSARAEAEAVPPTHPEPERLAERART
ncbi:MAG: DUF2933 domain-containing protein [Candidatus Limnocylindria bacterium]